MHSEPLNQWLKSPHRRVLVMGILNVTPDSFSDGGKFFDQAAAIARASEMIGQGVDVIDIGGESTRPGAEAVEETEQIRRVVPVIRRIKETGRGVGISIDTRSSEVAEAAINAGADWINDVSGGLADEKMLQTAAKLSIPIVLMHMKGTPATMQSLAHYTDVVSEVKEYLRGRMNAAMAAGVNQENILLDPGIGFGKTLEHDLALLRGLKEIAALGRPVVVGVSRKKFIGRITGETEPKQRIFGTAAAIACSVANGAGVVRVHDVAAMRQVVQVVEAIMDNKKGEKV